MPSKVEALVVVDSDLRSIVPEWIELLAGPILKGGFDFVAPLYSRYKYDGTITNTVTYPLTRALYGLRIRQPIGGDFGVSGDLVAHYLKQDDWDADVSKFGIDIWMTTKAVTGGFAVCQTRLGAKVHDPKDPGADLGPMFSQVVGTILRLTERHADRWLEVAARTTSPTTASSGSSIRRRWWSTSGACSRVRRRTAGHADAWAEIGTLVEPGRLAELAAEAASAAIAGSAASRFLSRRAVGARRLRHLPRPSRASASTTSGSSRPWCRSTSAASPASSSRRGRSTTRRPRPRRAPGARLRSRQARARGRLARPSRWTPAEVEARPPRRPTAAQGRRTIDQGSRGMSRSRGGADPHPAAAGQPAHGGRPRAHRRRADASMAAC